MDKLNLKAIILVGGFGTRLRPLTFYKAKPLVEFCNMPTLVYQIEALVKVGVNEIVLAINYQPEKLQEFITETEKTYNVKIVCSKEEVPLGTAGPIGLARDNYFKDNKFDYLFVFNADITCSYPLKELLNFHISSQAEGTIYTTKVEDPSKYGVVVSDENGKIQKFIEKPQVFISDNINAGLYCFSSHFLNRIETKPCSIEKDIFPQLANEGKMFSLNLPGFWMDVGQPKDYLAGTILFLNNQPKEKMLVESTNILSCVLADQSVVIEEGAVVGPNVVLGKDVVVKAGARIKNTVILNETIVGNYSYIEGSIIGWKNKIGKWVRINGLTITGEDVTIQDEITVDSSIILPNLSIKSNVTQGSKVIC